MLRKHDTVRTKEWASPNVSRFILGCVLWSSVIDPSRFKSRTSKRFELVKLWRLNLSFSPRSILLFEMFERLWVIIGYLLPTAYLTNLSKLVPLLLKLSTSFLGTNLPFRLAQDVVLTNISPLLPSRYILWEKSWSFFTFIVWCSKFWRSTRRRIQPS